MQSEHKNEHKAKRQIRFLPTMAKKCTHYVLLLVSAACIVLLVSCNNQTVDIPKSGQSARDNLLLLQSGGRVFKVDARGGRVHEIDSLRGILPRWAPDRRTFVFLSESNTMQNEVTTPSNLAVWLSDISGKERKELVHLYASDLFWAPGGDSVFLVSALGPQVYNESPSLLTSVDMHGDVQPIHVPEREIYPATVLNAVFSISPNGRFMAWANQDGNEINISRLNQSESRLEKPIATFKLNRPMSWSGGSYTEVSRPAWLTDDEIAIVDDEVREKHAKSSTGGEVVFDRIYKSTIWKWNINEGDKQKLAESDPWESFGDLTASPDGTSIAFLCQTVTQNPEWVSDEYEPGKEPNPCTLNMKNKAMNKLVLTDKSQDWLVRDLNWSSR